MTQSDERFRDEILATHDWVLVDFSAPWCNLCHMLQPTLNRLAREWEGALEVVALDVDEHFGMARHYAVQTVPTLVLFHDGVEVERLSHFRNREDLLSRCNQLMRSRSRLTAS
ncbi:MAG: thioredoxin family protein [Cyanobacteria bacterium J06642_2]